MLETVPDNMFYDILVWRNEVTCGQKPIESRQNIANALKTHFSEDMHFFQNNKRRWCIKTGTGRQQQYINNGLKHCLQIELKIFRNELFQATFATFILTEVKIPDLKT